MAVMPFLAGTVNAQSNAGIVTAYALNVRTGPDKTYDVKFVICKDDKVTIEESSNGWYKITSKNGKTGWASSKYIDIIEAFGTTDTYKRLCMEKNMKLIESLFGKMNTLPYTTYDNEQKFMSTLRRSLLWAFTRGKLITEEELQGVFNKFEDWNKDEH